MTVSATANASFTNTSSSLIQIDKVAADGSTTELCRVDHGMSGSFSATLSVGEKIKVARVGRLGANINGDGVISNGAVASMAYKTGASPAEAGSAAASATAAYSFTLMALNDTLELKLA